MKIIENYDEISLDTISAQARSCNKFWVGICTETCPHAKECVMFGFLPSVVSVFIRYANEIEALKTGKEPKQIDYSWDNIRWLKDTFYATKSLDDISRMAKFCRATDVCFDTCELQEKDICIGSFVARAPLEIFVRYAEEIERIKCRKTKEEKHE